MSPLTIGSEKDLLVEEATCFFGDERIPVARGSRPAFDIEGPFLGRRVRRRSFAPDNPDSREVFFDFKTGHLPAEFFPFGECRADMPAGGLPLWATWAEKPTCSISIPSKPPTPQSCFPSLAAAGWTGGVLLKLRSARASADGHRGSSERSRCATTVSQALWTTS